jgi:hypothetical protein
VAESGGPDGIRQAERRVATACLPNASGLPRCDSIHARYVSKITRAAIARRSPG